MPRTAILVLTAMLFVFAPAAAADDAHNDPYAIDSITEDESIWFNEDALKPAVEEQEEERVADAPVEAAPETAADTTATDESKPLIRHANSTDEQQELSKSGQRVASGGWLRTLGSLAAVVALIFLLMWGYRAVVGASGGMNLLAKSRKPYLIEIVSRTPLSAKQSLCLVRMGPRLVLVGVTPESMNALHVIDDEQSVARMLGQNASAKTDSRKAAFSQTLNEESSFYQTVDDDEDETPATVDAPSAESARTLVSESIQRLRAKLRNA